MVRIFYSLKHHFNICMLSIVPTNLTTRLLLTYFIIQDIGKMSQWKCMIKSQIKLRHFINLFYIKASIKALDELKGDSLIGLLFGMRSLPISLLLSVLALLSLEVIEATVWTDDCRTTCLMHPPDNHPEYRFVFFNFCKFNNYKLKKYQAFNRCFFDVMFSKLFFSLLAAITLFSSNKSNVPLKKLPIRVYILH